MAENAKKDFLKAKTDAMLDGLKSQQAMEAYARRLQKEASFMEGDIVHGSRQYEKVKARVTKEQKQLAQNIFYKQRAIAEQRAFDHTMKCGKNQCLEADVDPFPELPLDNVQWGNPVFMGPATTAYKHQF